MFFCELFYFFLVIVLRKVRYRKGVVGKISLIIVCYWGIDNKNSDKML